MIGMGLFSKKATNCTICNKELTHRHKPKKEWNIKGSLCGDCHFDKSKEYYEGKVRQPCVKCGVTGKITDLWEPRWQWDMDCLLYTSPSPRDATLSRMPSSA